MLSPSSNSTPLSPTSHSTHSLWSTYGTSSTTVQQSIQQSNNILHNSHTNNQYTIQQYTTQRNKLRQYFNIFSVNNNNTTIHISDIGTVLRSLDQYITQYELNTHIIPLFQNYIIDTDQVPYDQFESIVLHIIVDNMYPSPSHHELLHSYELLDSNHNGFLTVQQFIDSMKSCNNDSVNGMTDEQLNELVRVLCDSDTQLIHYHDYVNATIQTHNK